MATRRPPYNHVTTFDGVPIFEGLARILRDARADGVHFRLLSADRRRGVPERFGHLSQAALYAGWIAHRAGFNPANPPGRSTHELRSDGVAYRGPVGRPLTWWQEGLDLDGSENLRKYLVRKGYAIRRPYPAGSEYHHLNFMRNPSRRWRKLHA
jgi:hypothetical protein